MCHGVTVYDLRAQPECATQGPAPPGGVPATHLGTQIRAATRASSPQDFGDYPVAVPAQPQQALLRCLGATADAGANRQMDRIGSGYESSPWARMSIRQPVSRAASLAFWPSLPIAKERL